MLNSIFGILLLFPFVLSSGCHGNKLILGLTTLCELMFTPLEIYTIGNFSWGKGVSILGPVRSVIYLNIFPVFAIILSAISSDNCALARYF